MALSLRYADTLIELRGEALAKGQEFLTWNDVQKSIDGVNVQVHEEHERKRVALFPAYVLSGVVCGHSMTCKAAVSNLEMILFCL